MIPEPLPTPTLVSDADGTIDVAGALPESFYGEMPLIRRLGRKGYYRARGGGLVEFSFPSGRFVARLSLVPGEPDYRRFDVVYAEPYDANSAKRILAR